jgi:hypothetical protein
MSATAAPYGARPIGTLSANGSFSGKVRHIKIASGYATNIYAGDFVKLVAAGTLEKDAGTATMTPVGIFMGCAYTDPTSGQMTFNQRWPTGTVSADAVGYVIDDPDVLFQIQSNGSLAQTALGNNSAVVQTAGSDSIGQSKNAISSASATTATLPLRIVDFVSGPDSAVGDAFTDVICKFNAGHQYNNTTGV